MTRILLDTSAYSALQRHSKTVADVVNEADHLYVTPVVLGELLAGFRKGTHYARNNAQLSGFLEHENVIVLPIDSETAERYAIIYDFLRRAGTPVSPNDLWIAASAMQHGVKVLTTDRDFQKIPQILTYFHPPIA